MSPPRWGAAWPRWHIACQHTWMTLITKRNRRSHHHRLRAVPPSLPKRTRKRKQFWRRLPPRWRLSAPRPRKKLGDWLPESSGEHLPRKTPATQALSNGPQHRGEKSGSSGKTGVHNAGDDASSGSASGQGDPQVRGDISNAADDPAAGGSPRG